MTVLIVFRLCYTWAICTWNTGAKLLFSFLIASWIWNFNVPKKLLRKYCNMSIIYQNVKDLMWFSVKILRAKVSQNVDRKTIWSPVFLHINQEIKKAVIEYLNHILNLHWAISLHSHLCLCVCPRLLSVWGSFEKLLGTQLLSLAQPSGNCSLQGLKGLRSLKTDLCPITVK